MSDIQTRELFQKAVAWTTPRVTEDLASLGLAVGPFEYEFVDLNKGQHSKRPAHLLKCAKVSFARYDSHGNRGNLLEVDLVAMERKAQLEGVPLADLMVKVAAHEETHIAHNQDRPMAQARVILDDAFLSSQAELIALLDTAGDDGTFLSPVLASRQQAFFIKNHQLHNAVEAQPYLREGLAVRTEINVSSDPTRPDDRLPKYVDGPEFVSTILENPRLGPDVLRALMETTDATADDMFTPYEAEFDPDRWIRRIRRVGLPMGLPDQTFEQRFAAKYERNPGETIGRLLDAHARTGTALAIAQAGDGDQLPRPLAHLAWDIGHVAAEVIERIRMRYSTTPKKCSRSGTPTNASRHSRNSWRRARQSRLLGLNPPMPLGTPCP